MRRAPRWSIVDSLGNQRVGARVDGRAAAEQRHGLGRPAVVRERTELGVESDDVAVVTVDDLGGSQVVDQVIAAGGIARQITPGVHGHDGVVERRPGRDGIHDAANAADGVRRITRHRAVGERQRGVRGDAAHDPALVVDGAARGGESGHQIVRDRAVDERQCPLVVEAAAPGAVPRRRIARDGTAGERQRPLIVDAAALAGGRIVRDRALIQRQRGGPVVVDAAARSGRVARYGAEAQCHGSVVVDGAAVAGRGIGRDGAVAQRQRALVDDGAARTGAAVGQRQPRDVGAGLRADRKDATGPLGVDRQQVGARAVDRQVKRGDRRQGALGQRNRAGQAGGEDDRVAGVHVRVGIVDRIAERRDGPVDDREIGVVGEGVDGDGDRPGLGALHVNLPAPGARAPRGRS